MLKVANTSLVPCLCSVEETFLKLSMSDVNYIYDKDNEKVKVNQEYIAKFGGNPGKLKVETVEKLFTIENEFTRGWWKNGGFPLVIGLGSSLTKLLSKEVLNTVDWSMIKVKGTEKIKENQVAPYRGRSLTNNLEVSQFNTPLNDSVISPMMEEGAKSRRDSLKKKQHDAVKKEIQLSKLENLPQKDVTIFKGRKEKSKAMDNIKKSIKNNNSLSKL